MSNPLDRQLNRRQFLRQTFAFSALAAASPRLAFAGQASPAPAPDPNNQHMFFLGDWGTDKYPDQQAATARAMMGWVDQRHVHPGALFMLGDNWYGDMGVGFISPRWQSQFEQMYPTSHFPGPAYVVLGNHDYEHRVSSKVDLQLGYAAHAAAQGKPTRWTLPSRWYTFQYPQNDPVITFICLDSNLPGTKKTAELFLPWSFEMKKADRDQQDAWFRAELAKPRTTPFVACVCHHPLYSNGVHRDNHLLIRDWDALIRQYKVDFWISGHDHDLQHLEFANHPTSFVISGGGGAELVNWTTPPAQRGPFGGKSLGFSGMEFTKEAITFRHINAQGQIIHSFRKTPDGKVELFQPA